MSCQLPHWTRACQRSWTHRPSNPPGIQRSSHKLQTRGPHLVIRGSCRGANVKRDHPRRLHTQSTSPTRPPQKDTRRGPPLWDCLIQSCLKQSHAVCQRSQLIVTRVSGWNLITSIKITMPVTDATQPRPLQCRQPHPPSSARHQFHR